MFEYFYQNGYVYCLATSLEYFFLLVILIYRGGSFDHQTGIKEIFFVQLYNCSHYATIDKLRNSLEKPTKYSLARFVDQTVFNDKERKRKAIEIQQKLAAI